MNETVAPTPKSPPKYPDFCGRRKLQLEVQILNREVAVVQEELQSLERLQPVSVCCKEVNEFVAGNPDPLVPINKKRHGPCCRFWRWLGSKLCCCLSCMFCCTNCCNLKKPKCNNCCPNLKKLCCCCCFNCNWDCNCFHCPKVTCCKCPSLGPCSCCKCTGCFSCSSLCCCDCWGNSSRENSKKCCCSPTISCPEYSCGCVFDCPKCTNVRICPRCTKPCCVTGCLC